MVKQNSKPLSLHNFKVDDKFWKNEMELVRKEVIPYQWEILNDRVKDAAPSFCMRNFKIAGKLMKEKKRLGKAFEEPKYTFRGFEALPEDMNNLEDKFYGFVFQDSDFAKWIEAVAYSLINTPDAKLESIADEAIDTVCAAQQENGYLDTYYIINGMDKIFTNLRDHHELYCFGHLAEGACAYYEATGKDKLLRAVERFADFIDEKFGYDENKCKGYPGHEIAEMALVRLYEVTGKEKYLNLSKYFLDERGKKPYYFSETEKHDNYTNHEYHQSHLPVRKQDEAVGHAVRAVYLYAGMTDVAKLTNDDAMWEACKKLWNSVTKNKLYITGGIGATHMGEAFSYPYDLPNDTTYAETCASIGLIFWARRMLEVETKAEYADVMEQALYNTVLSGMALDGKSFFYVNPLEVLPKACHRDERKFHVKPVRQKWFGCACCPPNLARILSSIPSYAYTESEDTLYMHLFIGGEIKKKVNDREAVFKVESGYPWNGNVLVTYTNDEEINMTLAVRHPGWCKEVSYKTDDEKSVEFKDGYYYITGVFKKGDKFEMNTKMEPRVITADSRVRENIGKVAVVCGPVVYCMEETDNTKDLHLYEIYPDKEIKKDEISINQKTFSTLICSARKQKQSEDETLYKEYKKTEYEETEITLIPYYTWANRGENEMSVWIRVVK